MNIYLYGIIGYEEADRLYGGHREEVEDRFPRFFLRQFDELKLKAEALKKEALLINDMLDAEVPHYFGKIGKGGIYRALWEAGEALNCGLEVDICSIPVSQEVVEIMELFGADPYEADSAGSYLVVAEELPGVKSEEETESAPKPAFIGRTTRQRSRKLIMPEGERFLTPPSRQDKDLHDREIHSQKKVMS